MLLRCDSRSLVTTLTVNREIEQTWTDPLAALEWMSTHTDPAERWVGYLSYDLGRLFETIPSSAVDDLHLPVFCFARCESDQPIAPAIKETVMPPQPPRSSLPRPAYLDCVRQAIEYIRAGDVFQVNLSQRFTANLPADPVQIWQNLLAKSPAAYGAFLDFSDHAVISNSPELFFSVDRDRTIITRPIKGTRPRGPGMAEQLRDSLKDQAELNMIVDLERNDLGRICEVGSVKVTEPRAIETHPTVYHGAATITGRLRPDIGFVDLLRATFPGGSITGAPKIRAMQIIEQLEPVRRGPYCGAIGYLAGDGSMQFSVAIRTMTAINNQIHIPVGGGIVADSDPDGEYEETLTKAAAMFNALNLKVETGGLG